MKIAISSSGKPLDSAVDPRFGRAEYFIIVDPETMAFEVVENSQNFNLPQGAGIQAGKTIADHKVYALITGHCQEFALVEVEGNEIKITETLVPPPHEPGVLPNWLHQLGADVIIAGGMGQRAVGLFAEKGIKVVTSAPALAPEELVNGYLNNTLMTGANVCDH